MIKRIFDSCCALAALIIFIGPMLVIALLVKLSSEGPVLYWSDRVGKNNKIFKMPKFRTMQINTPVIATHLLNACENYITSVGSFLRKYSLDELPQLWCIFTGEMSIVGPRPALYNQYDLIQLRIEAGVDKLLPGITGWAQINGRDELPIPVKVQFDIEYLIKCSLLFDCKIILLTVFKVFRGSDVSH